MCCPKCMYKCTQTNKLAGGPSQSAVLRVRVTELRVKLHEGNPGKTDFSSSMREVQVSEDFSCWESTVHVYCIDCIHVDLSVARTDSPPSNASAA